MSAVGEAITILMADDDQEDCEMVEEALRESKLINDIRFVANGEELLEYLRRRGKYSDPADSPRPGIILLDLNMPVMDGREALAEIKKDPSLRRIPISILTTSTAEEDVFRSYDMGVNSFIMKPVGFEKLVMILKVTCEYWFQIVKLPTNGKPG